MEKSIEFAHAIQQLKDQSSEIAEKYGPQKRTILKLVEFSW